MGWNIINSIFERDTNRTASSVLSLHLWLAPCTLCSHTCTFTRLRREVITFTGGKQSWQKHSKEGGSLGSHTAAPPSSLQHSGKRPQHTGARKQSESSCAEEGIHRIHSTIDTLILTSSYISSCDSTRWRRLLQQMRMNEMQTVSYAVNFPNKRNNH